MSFLLDTDICSAYLRGDGRIYNRFVQHSGGLHVSAMTVGELYTWGMRSNASVKRMTKIREMLDYLVFLPIDHEVSETFGRVRAAMFDSGIVVATPDSLIAATALRHNLTLATRNQKHFTLVPTLRVVDWTMP